MPGTTVGVYAGELTAGTEVSSTYEGRHITVLETELIHPFRASGFVNKGDPVIICNAAVVAQRGNAIGIALSTATALTDYIAIDTEGIWNLTVFSYDDTGGGSAIVAGDPLYIHDGSTGGVGALGTGDATISKRRNNITQMPFGYALGAMVAAGTGQVAIKVHWDPIAHWLLDTEPLFFGDGRDVNLAFDETQLVLTAAAVAEDKSGLKIVASQAAGHNEFGIAWYADANYSGVMTATFLYGCGTWVNLDPSFDGAAVYGVVAAQDNGIYATTLTESATTDLVYGMRAECITAATVNGVYAFSLNAPAATTATHRAIFRADNVESVGHAVGHLAGVACGHIGLAYVNGSGTASVMYVNCWSA